MRAQNNRFDIINLAYTHMVAHMCNEKMLCQAYAAYVHVFCQELYCTSKGIKMESWQGINVLQKKFESNKNL